MDDGSRINNILAKLEAIESIKQVKAAFWRFMDTKDWAGLAEVFATDAIYDSRNARRDGDGPDSDAQRLGDDWVWHGRAGITNALKSLLVERAVSAHHGYAPEIEVLSETTASGVWAFEDFIGVRGADGAVATQLHGHGHDHDTYRIEDGRWRIASCRITRLWVTLG